MFSLHDEASGRLIGILGVYVDDFIIAGDPADPYWQQANAQLKSLYSWGRWQMNDFTICGVQYRQMKDSSIILQQTEFAEQLDTFQLPRKLNHDERALAGNAGAKIMRSGNGSVQWLASNVRMDLAVEVCMSAGNNNNPTHADIFFE